MLEEFEPEPAGMANVQRQGEPVRSSAHGNASMVSVAPGSATSNGHLAVDNTYLSFADRVFNKYKDHYQSYAKGRKFML